jgi:antitoxin CcdA
LKCQTSPFQELHARDKRFSGLPLGALDVYLACAYLVCMRGHDNIHTGGGKTRTNVSVDAGLLALARELRINVSAVLEGRLRELVAEKRSRVWLEEHVGAIADANEFLERRGLWSDGKRQF